MWGTGLFLPPPLLYPAYRDFSSFPFVFRSLLSVSCSKILPTERIDFIIVFVLKKREAGWIKDLFRGTDRTRGNVLFPLCYPYSVHGI